MFFASQFVHPRIMRQGWWKRKNVNRKGAMSAMKNSGFALRSLRLCGSVHRHLQSLVRQIQPIHDLVVFISRRRLTLAREGRRVRSLEVDVSPALLIEKWMLRRVVK